MGKNSLKTEQQQIILDEVRKNSYLTSYFYFTGGTALSLFYLHHRYSEDLDFFTSERFDNQTILTLVQKWSERCGFTFNSRFSEVVYVFELTFEHNIPLKVDFAYYPYKRIEKGMIKDGIGVDSLIDIAVNKLLKISQRTDVKDFVDLYFLLEEFSIWDLMEGVRVKFNMKLDPYITASYFLKVNDFSFLPRMIKPLELETLKKFFIERAKEIGKKSVE